MSIERANAGTKNSAASGAGAVAILLVNYQGDRDTAECINSILSTLTYPNYRIYVIDNSPDDSSLNILRGMDFRKTDLIKSERNDGFAAACNMGIRAAKNDGAEYVLLLNNDTVVQSSDLIERLLDCFSDPKVGMAGGKIQYFSDPEKSWYACGFLTPIRLRSHNREDVISVSDTGFITGCMQMIPMSVIDSVGLMKEDYFLMYEDADYCRRIQNAGYRTLYQPEAVILHKVSQSAPASSPTSIYNSNRARYLYIMRFHRKNPVIKVAYWMELTLKLLVYSGEKRDAIRRVFKATGVIRKEKIYLN